MINKLKAKIGLFLQVLTAGMMLVCFSVEAEPTSGPVKIKTLRSYHNPSGGPGAVYITVDQVSLCNTEVYRIPMEWGGTKETMAIALAAIAAGKRVSIEIDNSGCASPAWTTAVQSIYIHE